MLNNEKELKEIVNTINVFIDILNNFFSKLSSGQISAAKEMQTTLKKTLKSLRILFTKYFDVLTKYKLSTALQNNINSISNRLNELDVNTNDILLGLTDAEFAKEPETYKALLIEEFSELIENIKDSLVEARIKIDSEISKFSSKKKKVVLSHQM